MHKRLKKVIHPNRNLIWAVALCVFAGIILVAYIKITDVRQSAELGFPEVRKMHTYRDPQNTFVAGYPNHWIIEADLETNTISFENPINTDENISVSTMSLSQESALLRAVAMKHYHEYQKGNNDIIIARAADLKNSELGDVAIIKSPKNLYYIRSTSRHFDSFINNFSPQ